MTASDPRQPDQKPNSPTAASTESSTERVDDESIERALEAVEASADDLAAEASRDVDEAGEDMFASIESFLDDLNEHNQVTEAPEEREATTVESSDVNAQAAHDAPADATDDAFAQAMAQLGDDAMAAPAEVEAEQSEALNAAGVSEEQEDAVESTVPPSSSGIDFETPIEIPDVVLDESSEPAEPPADLTLDDEIANQLDDLFQTDLNDLDDVLNDVFGPEDDSRSDGRESTHDETPNADEARSARNQPSKKQTKPKAAAPVEDKADDTDVEESAADNAPSEESLSALDDDSAFSAPSDERAPTPTAAPAVNAAPKAPAAPAATKEATTTGASARTTASDDEPAEEPPAAAATPAPMVINAARPSAELDAKMESPLSEAIRQILVMVNGPVRSMPESKRTLVNWFALTLALWVPIVWAAAWFLASP